MLSVPLGKKHSEMLARLPLTHTDEAVEAIAQEHGWQEEFMTISRANLPIAVTRLRPPAGNHEVPQMFRAQRATAEAAAVGATAAPAAPGVPAPAPLQFGNGPLPAVPPPRPIFRRHRPPAAPEAAPATVSKASPPVPASAASPVGPESEPVVAGPNLNGNGAANLNGNGVNLNGNGGANLDANGGTNLDGNGASDQWDQ